MFHCEGRKTAFCWLELDRKPQSGTLNRHSLKPMGGRGGLEPLSGLIGQLSLLSVSCFLIGSKTTRTDARKCSTRVKPAKPFQPVSTSGTFSGTLEPFQEFPKVPRLSPVKQNAGHPAEQRQITSSPFILSSWLTAARLSS